MNSIRLNSLSSINLDQWNWEPFFKELLRQLSTFELESYPMSKDFLYKNAKIYINELETFLETKISSISTSPERNDTILIEDPFNV